jgi:hypothetical protein
MKKYVKIFQIKRLLQLCCWDDFDNYYKENKSFKLNITTYFESLKTFMEMTEDGQNERYNRMKKVREYIENPTPVEGIPWW